MIITIITVKIGQGHKKDIILTIDLGQDLPRIPEITQVNDMEIDKVNPNHILVATSLRLGHRMTYNDQVHPTQLLDTIDLVVKIVPRACILIIQKTRSRPPR